MSAAILRTSRDSGISITALLRKLQISKHFRWPFYMHKKTLGELLLFWPEESLLAVSLAGELNGKWQAG